MRPVTRYNPIWALKYAWITIKHRWFVLLAGLRIIRLWSWLNCTPRCNARFLWRLLIHDLSKFGPNELTHYGRQFFGDRSDPLGFSMAWLHHQRMNNHHWEAWIPITGHNRGGYKDMEPLPMGTVYILEMVADWQGAGRAYEGKWPGSDWPWFTKNFGGMTLEDTTREIIRDIRESLA